MAKAGGFTSPPPRGPAAAAVQPPAPFPFEHPGLPPPQTLEDFKSKNPSHCENDMFNLGYEEGGNFERDRLLKFHPTSYAAGHAAGRGVIQGQWDKWMASNGLTKDVAKRTVEIEAPADIGVVNKAFAEGFQQGYSRGYHSGMITATGWKGPWTTPAGEIHLMHFMRPPETYQRPVGEYGKGASGSRQQPY